MELREYVVLIFYFRIRVGIEFTSMSMFMSGTVFVACPPENGRVKALNWHISLIIAHPEAVSGIANKPASPSNTRSRISLASDRNEKWHVFDGGEKGAKRLACFPEFTGAPGTINLDTGKQIYYYLK
jgi:hypothetical protein